MEVSLTVNIIVALFFKIAVYCIPEVMPATFHLLALSSIFFKLLKTEKLETCLCLLFNVIFPLFLLFDVFQLQLRTTWFSFL